MQNEGNRRLEGGVKNVTSQHQMVALGITFEIKTSKQLSSTVCFFAPSSSPQEVQRIDHVEVQFSSVVLTVYKINSQQLPQGS